MSIELNGTTPRPPGDEINFIKEISGVLYNNKIWFRILAVTSVMAGVTFAISIIGIVIAWLPIWMGILLYQITGSIEEAYLEGKKSALVASLSKLGTYFKIMGALTIIGLVIQLGGVIVKLIK